MSQFNYGSNLGASTNQTGFTFGAAKTNTPTFGSLATTQTQPSGSITFGTPIASVAPTVQNTGLTFGTPTIGFGTPTSSAPSTGLNFGTPAKTTGLTFGAPSSQSSLNFGTPSAQPGLNFNTPTTQTGSSFGTPSTQTGLTFATTSQPSLNFGAVSTAAATPSLSFGTSTTANTGLSFGTPATSGGLNFNLAGTTTSAANPLGGINFGAGTTQATTSSLNFATPTSNVNPLGGINFNIPASSGLNFGLGGSTTVPSLNFKSSLTPASAAPTLSLGLPQSAPIGLGGIDSSQLKTGTVTTGRNDPVAAKENQVPNEILQSIENFKQFVKEQKSHSSDVSRGSARPFVKVREDIDLINSILIDVGNDLQRNQQHADKLKHDSAKCLHNAEMAQRTHDTPPGLQFENNAPLKYFIELVNQFEQDLQALRVQIDVTDKHFHSLHEPKFLTSQELATGMRRLHDTFVALAGRLHSVHTQVESHKEQYLNLRKYILKDPTNIFLKHASKEEQALDVALRGLAANKSFSGPTPFSSLGSPFGLNILQAQQTTKPPPAYPATTTSLSSGNTLLGATGSLFGNTTLGLGQSLNDSSFQLQSPPPGNKRGKR